MPMIYADIGSAVTKLAAGGRTAMQESRVALDPQNSSCVLAVGERARRLLNTTAVYPVRGGRVANIELAAIMLRRMTLELINRRSVFGVSLKLVLPQCAPDMQRLAAVETAKAAGFRRVSVKDALMAAATGAGVDIDAPRATMIADLGRDKLAVGVCANGGLICSSIFNVGSDNVDRAIQSYFAREYGLLVGARTAENVKLSLHLPHITAVGRSIEDGSPKKTAVRSSEIRSAIQPVCSSIAHELTEALNSAPPDAAADICDNGIVMAGGGSLLFGLSDTLEARLGVAVTVAANAQQSAIFGAMDADSKRRAGDAAAAG